MKQHPAYGTERIALNLSVSKQKVHRIKQKFNLYPIKSKRKPKKKRDLGKDHSSHSNLIKDLTVIAPRTVYASDFTYIPFEGKFVYLATVIDLFTREIVGWQVSRRHTASMIKEALLDSIQRTGQTPDLIHSDQGSEYKSKEYQNFLKANQIKCSMSSKASPWQNDFQESFYGSFKEELDSTKEFENLGELIEAIHQTINYYNKDRIHTVLKISLAKFFQNHKKLKMQA